MSLPPGHNLRAAVFWMGFSLRRNLRKRAFKLWAGAIVLLVVGLDVGARAGVAELGQLVVPTLTPLLCLFFGTGVLREEIEDQTLTYPFTRPVRRAWLYAARVLAAGLPVAILSVPAAVYVGLSSGPETAFRLAAAAALATVAYTALFALAGLLIKWPTWFGLAFLLFWEAGVGQVPGFLGKMTLITHVRAVSDLVPTFARQLEFLWAPPTVLTSVTVLLAVSVVCLWLGGQLVRRREFVLTR